VETNGLFSEQTAKTMNEEPAKVVVTNSKKSTKTQQKLQQKQQQLEELAGKDKLTTGEARKMAKLITETTETDAEREQKRNLNLTRPDSLIKVTKDTLALLRDSTFWEISRKAPLSIEELQSYLVRDSLKEIADSLETADSVKNRKPATWLGAIVGGNEKKIGKKVRLDFDGFTKVCPEFNFVDGFWLGQKLSLSYDYTENSRIIFKPSVYYTTARKALVWRADASMTYAPMRDGYLAVSMGNTTRDFAGARGTNRFFNAIASLVFAENTAKFYQSRFAGISNYIDLANGLRLNTRIDYEKRNELSNNTSFNFFKRTPDPNIPIVGDRDGVGEPPGIAPTDKLTAYISIEYTPRYYYYVTKGRKYYSRSAYPTFLFSYEKAFPGGKTVNPSYDRLELSIVQDVKLDIFSSLRYRVNAGMFLNNDRTYLPDYRHFLTNELFITDKSLYNSFALPDNYRFATNDRWLQAHVSYTSDYLLIKRLPFLQKYPLEEDLHVKTLFLRGVNHSEAGYSIGFGDLGRLGVFVGFDDWKYESTGIIFSFPIVVN
jgi:hypothetical protein